MVELSPNCYRFQLVCVLRLDRFSPATQQGGPSRGLPRGRGLGDRDTACCIGALIDEDRWGYRRGAGAAVGRVAGGGASDGRLRGIRATDLDRRPDAGPARRAGQSSGNRTGAGANYGEIDLALLQGLLGLDLDLGDGLVLPLLGEAGTSVLDLG